MSNLIAPFPSRILFLIPVIPIALAGKVRGSRRMRCSVRNDITGTGVKKMKAHQLTSSPILRCLTRALCPVVLMLAGTTSLAQAQQVPTTARGFQPAGSYALSDLETINTVNGNMILNFPLGKLAPGRGGLSAGINVNYNSKLYDTRLEYAPDDSNQITAQNFLKTSDAGGWRYGFKFSPLLFNRLTGLDSPPQCPDQQAMYIWKLRMIFPDGNSREFRPTGFIDNYGDGYYTIRPDGWQTSCNGGTQPSVTTGMTYYSTDGTYMRLFFPHTNNWLANWTLSMPDGSRVVVEPGLQRVYDRNGNYIEISSVTNYNNTNHPADVITDQLGRTVALEKDVATQQDYIYSIGANGEQLKTTVKWKTIYVNRGYRTTSAAAGKGRGGTSWQSLDNLPLRVIDRITLPAQAGSLAYVFGYNGNDTATAAQSYGYGELTSILMPSQGILVPTKAQSSYNYALDSSTPPTSGQFPNINFVLDNHPSSKTLTYQAEYDGTSTQITETWQYSINVNKTTSSVTAPDGGVTTETHGTTAIQNSETGLNYKTERPDGTVVEHLWQRNLPVQVAAGVGLNPFIKTEFTSIKDAAGNLTLTAIKDYNYDKNGNVTQVKEYDWVSYFGISRDAAGRPTGIPVGLTPKRVTNRTYYNSTPDASDSTTNSANTYIQPTAPQLRNAIASAQVSNNANQTLSRTEFNYDNPATTGNLIQQTSWDSTKGAMNPSPPILTTSNSVSVSTQYNQYGSPILNTDARGFQTQLTYGAVGAFTDLYPTQIKTAFGTSIQRTENREYDFGTGLVTRVTDADNNVATATTYDALGRPTLVKAAEGKPEEVRTSMEYSDTARRVITRSDQNALNDGKLVSIQHYDQLGRIRLTRQLEDSATQDATDETQGIKVQTRYKYSGANNYQVSSHPYREAFSWQAPAAAMDWNRAKADNGGRLIEVQKFGGNSLPEPWSNNTSGTGQVITTYDANLTTVTDQAGKVRRSVTDGLGRLVRVDEPDQNNNLDVNGIPFQSTSYSYDALDNLTSVTQGAQTRTFVYDSLKRLTSATNPESGTINYQYDNNGNLTQKTDARGVVATYAYDALNRNTSVTYTNDPAGTPTVTHTYDGATNGKGRLWKTETGGASGSRTTINSFDALGRPASQSQQFYASGAWSQSFSVSATYDKAGHVLTLAYPSAHTISYSYDSAGRTSSFTGNLGDGTQRTYSSGMVYSAFGAMTKEQFGADTPIFNKLFYNSRGQLAEIRESTSYTGPTDTDWNRGAIINHYSNQAGCWGATCNATDNNGNLRRQEVYIPHDDQMSSSDNFAQFYDYDSLNRLQAVRETLNGGAVQWQQAYTYDRWGNRTIDQTNTWGNGINKKDFTVNTGNNRLGVPGGQTGTMSYDAAGNLTTDTYSGAAVTRAYDAENRMISETQANNYLAGSYTYNADGQRVRRTVGGQPSAVTTWQVYGFGGELLAEYAASALPVSPQKEYGYRNGQLLITADVTTGPPVPTFSDDFNDNSLDPAKWSVVAPTSPAVVSETGQRLQITLPPNTAGYNGISSNATFDLTGKSVQVEVAQTVSQAGWCENFMQVALDGQNYFLINAGAGSLVLRSMVNGVNDQTIIPTFDPVAHHYWRIRHDQNANTINFDTSADGSSWTTRKTAAVAFSLTGLRFYLYAGAWGTGNGSPGAAKYDNFQLISNTATTIANVQWLVADQLGTPRMIFDKTGALANVKRHDYLPFGEEIFAGTGGRTTTQGYTATDGVRQQFTQKERDNETGLDYFLARYYSSTQGRFTSPDEFKGGPEELFGDVDPHDPLFYADTAEPQSLNKYHYALNNPLRYIDPDGHQTTTADRLKAGVADFVTGVGRGITSSITIGASGAPQESDSLLNRAGQGVGTVLTSLAGRAAIGSGIVITGGSGGLAAEVGVPVVVAGAEAMVGSTVNAVRIATTPMQRNSTSSDRAGKEFTKTGKETVVEQNKAQNNGQTKCNNCGAETVPGQQSKKGVAKPSNETQVDHIRPKSRGGQGRPDNGQVLCRKCNQAKGNKLPE